MATSIFSTYSTGENRVTASIIAVLGALALPRISRLLGALLEESELELIQFQNQPADRRESVPDAMILASCRVLIETKTKPNSLHVDQLRNHLKQLEGQGEMRQALLVLTPDQYEPEAITKLADSRVAWSSFQAFDQAIEELLSDSQEVISEREAFLLRELQKMLAEEGLLRSEADVLIVPARIAWPMYHEKGFHAYACQPKRPFRAVSWIGFYFNGAIQPLIPRILDTYEEVVHEKDRYQGALGRHVDRAVDEGLAPQGQLNKIMILSAPDDPQTVKLPRAVQNDLVSSSGRAVAFTQGQRYVSLDRLRTARTTSELA